MFYWVLAAAFAVIAVPAVPVGVVRHRAVRARAAADARAEQEERERRHREEQKAQEAAQRGKAEAERQRIQSDAVGHLMIPAGHGLLNSVLPAIRSRQLAEYVVAQATALSERAAGTVQNLHAKLGWLQSPTLQTIVSLGAFAAIPIVGAAMVLDWITFSQGWGVATALVYTLAAVGALGLFPMLAIHGGLALRSAATVSARYVAGVVALAGVLATIGTMSFLLSVAHLRSDASSADKIAVAQGQVSELESRQATGDPTFSKADLAAARTGVTSAIAAQKKAVVGDQSVMIVLAVLEAIVMEAALQYFATLRPLRHAEREAQLAEAAIAPAEAQLEVARQAVTATGERLAQDLADYATEMQIPNPVPPIHQAVYRARVHQQATVRIVDPRPETEATPVVAGGAPGALVEPAITDAEAQKDGVPVEDAPQDVADDDPPGIWMPGARRPQEESGTDDVPGGQMSALPLGAIPSLDVLDEI